MIGEDYFNWVEDDDGFGFVIDDVELVFGDLGMFDECF